MLRSFRCTDTRSLADGWAVPRFQAIERVARRKLRQLEIASRLATSGFHPVTAWKRCAVIEPDNRASASTTSTGCVFDGRTAARKTLNLLTTTDTSP